MIISSYLLDEYPSYPIKTCIESFRDNFFHLFSEQHNGNFWIAGGSLLSYFSNTEPKDIDIYFKDVYTFNGIVEALSIKGGLIVDDNPKVLVISLDGIIFDLVKNYHVSPEATLRTFDLSVSMCAVTNDSLYCIDSYWTDLATKNVSVHSVENPTRTFMRLMKYGNIGYNISIEEALRFMYQIKNSNEYLGGEEASETVPQPKNSSITPDKPQFNKIFAPFRGKQMAETETKIEDHEIKDIPPF
jgi:hypothetical protein